jgi:hypothetical protein
MDPIEAQIENLQRETSLLEDESVEDVEELLQFSEKVFCNAATLWEEAATLHQRQRLQAAFFPVGLSYAAGEFRTARMSCFFRDFWLQTNENGRVASPTGFEPVFWP